MPTPTHFIKLTTERAPKTSLNAEGCITYLLLKDDLSSEIYFSLFANDGGGYFSREAVPLAAIESCIAGFKPDQVIPAKAFRRAFQGKSVNNPGFLTAVLRHCGLLLPAPDVKHRHVIAPDWSAWKAVQLASAGEPFEFPSPDAEATAPLAAESLPPAKKGRKTPKPVPEEQDYVAAA